MLLYSYKFKYNYIILPYVELPPCTLPTLSEIYDFFTLGIVTCIFTYVYVCVFSQMYKYNIFSLYNINYAMYMISGLIS